MCQLSYFPLSPALKLSLIEGYFALDKPVVRELIGKKLVGKTRRDLDGISERTWIPLASCRRQFDNLCSILRRMEGANDLYRLLQRKFLISEDLAKFYFGILFLNYQQIDVNQNESIKDLPLDVILECSHAFIQHWSIESASLALDSTIAHDVRELKASLSYHQSSWIECLASNQSNETVRMKISQKSTHLPILVKNILQIGGGLVQTKEIRDLLIDISDLVVAPLVNNLGLDTEEIRDFFNSLPDLLKLVPNVAQTNPRAAKSFKSFISGLLKCSLAIRSSLNQ